MKLEVKDYSIQGEALIGKLYINGELACYTLEDRTEGVNNRVQRGGPFKVALRNEGGVNEYYSKHYPAIHKGMIHLLVPGRRWILIHIGNTEDDTLGCLLVGTTNNQPGKVENSTAAYLRIYPKIAEAVIKGEEVTITYAPIENK